MRQIEAVARAAYRTRFAAEPAIISSAPGRVNLLGEHTDYNGGYVLPCAIDRRVAVALGPISDGGGNTLYSVDYDEARPLTRARTGAWADFPSGIVWALSASGKQVPAFQASFAGDVPRGAGLSSSAAIESATILALNAFAGWKLPREELSQISQRAENQFVGVPCGIMDQYATLLCQADGALLLDCHTMIAEQEPLDLTTAHLALVVCDTGVERRLAQTGYQDRRLTCERAARRLGVAFLCEASENHLVHLEGEELQRARHVVMENARVLSGVDALRRQDFAEFGQLMYASHASLRDDYGVSTPELDTFVTLAQRVGALGARLTGAGFGGCAIALIEADQTGALFEAVNQSFIEHAFPTPKWYIVSPSAGAEVYQ